MNDFERSKPSLEAHRANFLNPNSDWAFVGAESYDKQKERDKPIDHSLMIDLLQNHGYLPHQLETYRRNVSNGSTTYTKVLETVSKSTPYDNQMRFHPIWLNGPKPTSTPTAYENRERNAKVVWFNGHADSKRSESELVEPHLSNGFPDEDFRRTTEIGEAIDRLEGDVEIIFLLCCWSEENAGILLEYEKVKRIVYFGDYDISEGLDLEFIFEILINYFENHSQSSSLEASPQGMPQ